MPVFSAGCSRETPLAEQNQVLVQKEKCLELSIKLEEKEDELEKKNDDYSKLEKDKKEITNERDKLEKERREYPRNTPEDVIRENKVLRTQLFKNEVTSSSGYRILTDMLEDNRDLRGENWRLKRENQNARIYLERQGVYLSDINGREINITQSPLDLERAQHKETKTELTSERVQRNTDRLEYEIQNIKIGQELREALRNFESLSKDLERAVRDRDLYRKGYEEWKKYGRSLEDPKTDSGK